MFGPEREFNAVIDAKDDILTAGSRANKLARPRDLVGCQRSLDVGIFWVRRTRGDGVVKGDAAGSPLVAADDARLGERWTDMSWPYDPALIDAVGMSTAPEAIVAAQAGLRVSAVSAITNVCLPDCLAPVSVARIAVAAEPKLRGIVLGV